MQDDADAILKGKDKGDRVIRQVFTAANIWLRDRYVNLPDYPFVDFRFEPGNLYQVPLIERFIPQNKSLDALVSRAERYSHTMVTGSWSIRKGEDMQMDNGAGGQVVKYASTPPVQNQIAPIPQFFFELMQFLTVLIEEQGVSLSTLGKLPTGVKGHLAIEALKESEYANLVIPSRRLKNTVKRVAEKMLDIADNHFVTPQTVYDMKDGKPAYFDVIGGSALEGRKKLKVDSQPLDAVPLKKDYKVDIEVQTGVAYTHEGRKQAAQELGKLMIELAQLQLLNPEAVKAYFKQVLDIYKFGPTEDIMEALENPELTSQLTDQQLTQMKIAVLQALKDAGEVGQEASDKRVQESALGAIQAIKDTGLADSQPQDPKMQAELEAMTEELKMKKEEHLMKMAQMQQDMQIKQQETGVEADIKQTQAAHGMAIKETQSEHQMKINQYLARKQASQPQGGQNAVQK